MAVKSHSTNNFLLLSSSNCRLSNGSYCVGRKVSDLHCLLFSKWGRTRKGCLIQHDLLSLNSGHGLVGCKKYYLTFSKDGRSLHLFPFATSDDGMTVNGSPQADPHGPPFISSLPLILQCKRFPANNCDLFPTSAIFGKYRYHSAFIVCKTVMLFESELQFSYRFRSREFLNIVKL